MLVNEFLEQSVSQYPDKTALICHGRRFTYVQIEDLANKLANGLIDLGLKHGERAAIYLDNSSESVISIFSILKASGVFVVINPQVKVALIELVCVGWK